MGQKPKPPPPEKSKEEIERLQREKEEAAAKAAKLMSDIRGKIEKNFQEKMATKKAELEAQAKEV